MDPQLSTALIALGITVVGALGTLVTVLVERVKRDLAQNTQLTQEAKEASNGRLKEALSRLAAEHNKVVALRVLLRERDDRFEYVRVRLPEVERVLVGYRERRQTKHSPADEIAAEQRIISDDLDDPTGTDAGAHPL